MEHLLFDVLPTGNCPCRWSRKNSSPIHLSNWLNLMETALKLLEKLIGEASVIFPSTSWAWFFPGISMCFQSPIPRFEGDFPRTATGQRRSPASFPSELVGSGWRPLWTRFPWAVCLGVIWTVGPRTFLRVKEAWYSRNGLCMKQKTQKIHNRRLIGNAVGNGLVTLSIYLVSLVGKILGASEISDVFHVFSSWSERFNPFWERNIDLPKTMG